MITRPRLAACLAGFLRLGWSHLSSISGYDPSRSLSVAFGTALPAPLRSLLSTRGGGWKRIDPRSQISVAPPSPQCSNLRVSPQFPRHIVTAGPEDDASGAAGLELDETSAQLLASACERHLFGGGYVDERVAARLDRRQTTHRARLSLQVYDRSGKRERRRRRHHRGPCR